MFSTKQYRSSLVFLLGLITATVFSQTSQAALIIDKQPFDDPVAVVLGSGAQSEPQSGWPSLMDDFTLSSTVDITRISFWTLQNSNVDLYSSSFSLNIYSNDFPDLGTPLYSVAGDTNLDPAFSGLYKHTVEVTGLTLIAGEYLFNLGAALSTNTSPLAWVYSSTPAPIPAPDYFINPIDGNVTRIDPTVEMAFQIEGEVVEANAPATFLLTGVALALLAIRRKTTR